MPVLAKIALRNVFANKKRSVLIGVAISFSCLLMLVTNAIYNGSSEAILKSYMNIQVAHVVGFWNAVNDYDSARPERVFYSYFDVDKEARNRGAIARTSEFLESRRDGIHAWFPTLLQEAFFTRGNKNIYATIYGITDESARHLFDTKTMRMSSGQFGPVRSGICISRQYADDFGAALGDQITISCTTPYGAKNQLDFFVTGIYDNGPGWLNSLIYMGMEDAFALFDFDPGAFNIARVYLENPERAKELAEDWNSYLAEYTDVFHAETWLQASTFYTDFPQSQRAFYLFGSVFLLMVIGLGVRSTMRMSLFERMGEFGTLRAIGFSRCGNFSIAFYEIFFLSVMALVAAFVLDLVFVLVFGSVGVYVGTGPMSYMFGGDRFFPKLMPADVLFALTAVFLLSIASLLKPGLTLAYQGISDMLLRRQRRVVVTLEVIRSLFGRKGRT